MASKKKQPEQVNGAEEMFKTILEIEKEKGIDFDVVLESIKRSIEKACKSDEVDFVVDKEKGVFEAYIKKIVVEDVTDPKREIDEFSAKKYDPFIRIGEKIRVPLDTKKLGRNSVSNAGSVIRQGIRDKEREITLKEFEEKNDSIVTVVVESIDHEKGNATVKIGRSTATLTKAEQVGLNNLKEGDSVKVYLVISKEKEDDENNNGNQKKKSKGPKAIISRRSEDFVKKLLEIEVPELRDGTVEIKSMAREAGSRTKMAVYSKDPNVDSAGACIGVKGSRIHEVVQELGGEKIDIIEYKEDKSEFIAAALSPAPVVSVELIDAENNAWKVVVPDDQLSLAIGNKGQNARLAAKLTGCKIDICPQSGIYDNGKKKNNKDDEEKLVEDSSESESQEEMIVIDEDEPKTEEVFDDEL